jgi:precorrin-8X/cobalt-precorrin-8 methylmutase
MTALEPPPSGYAYERDGAAIYRASFAAIRDETDLTGVPPDAETVAVRMVHATGQTDLTRDLVVHERVVGAAREALRGGAPILCDAHMVASGVTRARLPKGNEVLCTLRDTRVPDLAAAWGTTRSAAAVSLWGDRLEGAVVAIGNAPTALFHLLDLLRDSDIRPAAILGIPVGFIGAAESKAALADNDLDLGYIVVHGRRGGSAITCGALNAIASEEE